MTIANPVTWTNLCAEFGLTPSTAVFPRDFYGKGGAPSSGSLSFQDFVGRSGLTFTPGPGSYFKQGPFNSPGSMGVSANQAVVWTYTKDGTINASQASGISSTGINFSTTDKTTQGNISLTATYGGQSYFWDITLVGGNSTGGA